MPPLYELICTRCEYIEERLLKLEEDNPGCSLCASETQRLIGLCDFNLKGDGYYQPGPRKQPPIDS